MEEHTHIAEQPASPDASQGGPLVPNVAPQDFHAVPPMPAIPQTPWQQIWNRFKAPIVIAGIIFTLLFVTMLVARLMPPKPIIPTPTRVTTPTPTPTPVREPSAVASTSAFLQLEQSVGSLGKAINSVNVYDTALTPPTITIPLGFSKE